MRIPDYTSRLLTLIIIVSLLSACKLLKKEPVKIAVSKASRNYINWMKKADSNVVLIDMYHLDPDSALALLDHSAGLLLTGGEDVQPEFYGKSSEKNFCGDMDPQRDTLEIALIRKAIELKMPILGVCRGEQILNVALGGTLIVDIPAYFRSAAGIQQSTVSSQQSAVNIQHQCEDYLQCFHSVNVVPATLLRGIIACDTGFVTSNHHQAIDLLAPGLRCNAVAYDGITEGIEWTDPVGKSFLIGVQWHPERMDTSNSMSGKLLVKFYSESLEYYKNHLIK